MRLRIWLNRRDVKWLSASYRTKYRGPDRATTGLEQPLLEVGQGPALDGERQGKPTEEVAEIVGDDPEE